MECFVQWLSSKSKVFEDRNQKPLGHLAHGSYIRKSPKKDAAFSDHHRQHGYGRAQGGLTSCLAGPKKPGDVDPFFVGTCEHCL